ncbi:helix-turn-helix domain-containing protein [Chryseobacterium koreense]|uniref:helix-turn-helix domain-containing protein n=1 Tax=Chryseobacterium koreense TaxID=232216 RepID=UPI00065AFBE0|nr:helix-turn-helix transcriptional regulator [Chryseobacterium koreense]MBB5334604.1 transcriptional regulator with XRE-family HTH domain [Chryseobacterium koreense]
MTIGNRIKEARELVKLSQKEVANRLEMDPSQFSKIEKGKVMPTLLQIVEISKILKRSLDWLVTGEAPEAEEQPIDYKNLYELAKQNNVLLSQVIDLKDQLEKLKSENISLQNKRSEAQNAYSLVAEPIPELKKRPK